MYFRIPQLCFWGSMCILGYPKCTLRYPRCVFGVPGVFWGWFRGIFGLSPLSLLSQQSLFQQVPGGSRGEPPGTQSPPRGQGQHRPPRAVNGLSPGVRGRGPALALSPHPRTGGGKRGVRYPKTPQNPPKNPKKPTLKSKKPTLKYPKYPNPNPAPASGIGGKKGGSGTPKYPKIPQKAP